MRKVWPFAFYFLLFAGIAFMSPYLVLYYQGLGFTGTQIGLLTGIGPLLTLVSAPLWTGIADRTNRHRLLMSLAILCGVFVSFLFPFLNAFVPVFLLAAFLSFSVAPITPFADSATMFMLADEKEMYGRIRLGGTIGYGLAALIAGLLIQDHGIRYGFWGCAFLLALALFVSQRFEYGQLEPDSPDRGRVRILLTDPRWILFLVVSFVGGVGMAAFNNFLFPYMDELGAGESIMGIALTVGTIAEIPVLFFGNRLIKRFKPFGLLMVAMAVIGFRMVLFAAVRTPGSVLLIQLLNGLTVPAFAVAGVSYADEHAPAGMKTTAQGLFSAAVFGFGMAVGGLVGGPLLESIGGRGLYLVFGIATLAVVAITVPIQRFLPAEKSSPNAVTD